MTDVSAALFLVEALRPARRTRVVDVGANPLSDPPYGALLRAGGCEVIGFEPQKEAYEALLRTKAENETYLPHAVGEGGEITLNLCANSGFTSALAPDAGSARLLGWDTGMQVTQSVALQTVRIDDLPELADFDLLKIDIQGGEVAVFRGAQAALSGAVAVIAELRFFPLYRDEPMAGGAMAELAGQGFELHRMLPVTSRKLPMSQDGRLRVRRMRDQIVDGDGVFVRDLRRLEALEDERVKHMAILAAGVFASHSLAIYCLDELVRRGVVGADLPGAYVDRMPAELRLS